MPENIEKTRGTIKAFKNDKGGAVTRNYPLIGVVKNNIDPTKNGRIQVYIADFGTTDPNDSKGWITVDYLSPYYGVTHPDGSKTGEGTYVSNPHSYGWWSTAPDIDTQVLCVFVNGDINFGYYIGCIPQAGLNHMIPAIGASSDAVLNSKEAQSYGGATRLPATEINQSNANLAGASDYNDAAKPVHSYQAAILNRQGLIRDPDRGPIGSTATRESPSRVFGFSTPGRPIYDGGYNDTNVGDAAAANAPDAKFKVIGRRGGHTLVMDDGDLGGKDELFRLRSSSGHQILMNDTAKTIFIIHANGQSWIEMGKEGTIDMFSTNSVNVRTQGDINFHADRDINVNAKKKFNLKAEEINIESEKDTNVRTGTNFSHYVMGKYALKTDGVMTLASEGVASFLSKSTTYINGRIINLNTGTGPQPDKVKALPVINHTDTFYDASKGFAAAPGTLPSITTRAPAHSPWANANMGVDIKVTPDASANLPAPPNSDVQAANANIPSTPPKPVTAAVASTVPQTPAVGGAMNNSVSSAVVAQNAVNAATGPASDIVKSSAGSGVVSLPNGEKVAAIGTLAQSPSQLVEAGYLKPGADVAINKAIENGMPIEKAMDTSLFTGKNGITSLQQFASNVTTQVSAQIDVMTNSLSKLTASGILTGNESATQMAGLVNTVTAVGLPAAVDFIKQTAGAVSGLTSATAISSLVNTSVGAVNNVLNSTGIANLASSTVDSVQNLMASGNFAANVGEQISSGISSIAGSVSALTDKIGTNITASVNSIKGVTGAAFDAVVSSFPTLKANVPQNLAGISEMPKYTPAFIQDPNTGEMIRNTNATALGLPGVVTNIASVGATLSSAVSSVQSSIGSITSETSFSNALSTGLTGIPGGVAATGSIVNNAIGAFNAIPGTSSLQDAVNNAVGSISQSLNTVAGSVLGSSTALQQGGGLMSSVASSLSPDAAASLNSAIGSITSGGSVPTKVPSLGENTFGVTAIATQTTGLLGDPKVPALKFGNENSTSGVSSDVAMANASYESAKNALETARDDDYVFRQKYYDLALTYGNNDPKTIAAYNAWKQHKQKIETLQQQLDIAANNMISKLA